MIRVLSLVLLCGLLGHPAEAATNAARSCLERFFAGDLKAAQVECEPLATIGEPAGNFVVGALAEMGANGAPQPALAERGYRAAASEGFAPAQTVLAVFLQRGAPTSEHCAADLAEAARWLAAAAGQGYAPAQVRLGITLSEGLGVPSDPAAAAGQFRAAAQQGSADALFLLGGLYRTGHGVPQDNGLAGLFFAQAAERGHPAAAHNLGVLLNLAGRPDAAKPWLAKGGESGVGMVTGADQPDPAVTEQAKPFTCAN